MKPPTRGRQMTFGKELQHRSAEPVSGVGYRRRQDPLDPLKNIQHEELDQNDVTPANDYCAAAIFLQRLASVTLPFIPLQ